MPKSPTAADKTNPHASYMSVGLESALLSAIRAVPDDDAPRLIYADWLDEQGTTAASARADFIRTQCLLTSGTWPNGKPLTPEEEQELEASGNNLLEAHWEKWLRSLQKLGAREVEYRRGFPHYIRISARSFLANAARIFEQAPMIQSVLITDLTNDQMAALAGSEHLRNLTTLDLSYTRIGDAGAAALAGSEHLRDLTTLNLAGNSIGPEGAAALAGSEHLRNLTTLDLSGNVIPEAILNGITQMLASRRNNRRE